MLRRIKGVTLGDKVKSVDIRKEQGVSSIQEKVREMRLRWYGHMQRMEENDKVRAVVDTRVPGKRQRGRPRGRWIASEGICRHCGSPRRLPRTEHSGNQEFELLTPAPRASSQHVYNLFAVHMNKKPRLASVMYPGSSDVAFVCSWPVESILWNHLSWCWIRSDTLHNSAII